MSSNFHVAVVGSGPAGFYAAEALLRSGLPIAIDMFERLPVPHGLVRFGVAPDHPKLKLVSVTFDKIAAMPGFRFIGGVSVGEDIGIDELRAAYDGVVLATGADLSRPLGIPGETLPGSYHAGDFVAWYNSRPDSRDLRFDLDHEVAVVIGHGNVALDVARILSKTVDELRQTDIATHALEVLAESRIREVHVVGRSGPLQAKFGAKELRDFLSLSQCDPWIDPNDLAGLPQATGDAEQDDRLALFRGFAAKAPEKPRRCIFRFGLTPVAVGRQSHVESISCRPSAKPVEVITCGAVFSSIGRRTAPIAGVPYDDERGVHANLDGRVVDGERLVHGVYVCGWSKRGPSGTIGTNRACGMATAEAVVADLAAGAPHRSDDPDALMMRLRQRGRRLVSYQDWMAIDAAEKRRGQFHGRPREKFVSVPDMIAALETAS